MDLIESLKQELLKNQETDIEYLKTLQGPERAAILRRNPRAREFYRQAEIKSVKKENIK